MVFSFFKRSNAKRESVAAVTGADDAMSRRQRLSLKEQMEQAMRTVQKIDAIEEEMRLETVIPAAESDNLADRITLLTQPSTSVAGHALEDLSLDDIGGFANVTDEAPATPSLPRVLEEVAVMYANGQVLQAQQTLLAATREPEYAHSHEVWLMLLDLLLLMDEQAAYEDQALAYAIQFEQSPPVMPVRQLSLKRIGTHLGPSCALPAHVDGTIGTHLNGLLSAQKNQALSLDCSLVRRIELSGVAPLQQALMALVQRGSPMSVSGVRYLWEAWETLLTNSPSQEAWELAFCLLRILGDSETFEHWALRYAVQYEVSPPSWEPAPPWLASIAVVSAQNAPPLTIEREQNLVRIAGTLSGQIGALVDAIQQDLPTQSTLIIDATDLLRVDFSSAGALLAQLLKWESGGLQVKILHCNQLVRCFFAIIGLHAFLA